MDITATNNNNNFLEESVEYCTIAVLHQERHIINLWRKLSAEQKAAFLVVLQNIK